jgi:hypothetical protein
MKKFYKLTFRGKVTILAVTVCFCALQVFAKDKIKFQKIKPFIPIEYELLDSSSGDLNSDGFWDFVMILKSKQENTSESNLRPLLLLLGNSRGSFDLIARNDSVVLCGNCGGIYGDPFQGVSISDGYLSVKHLVGSNWRWTRVISFKYDSELKDFVLYKDAGISYHISSPNKQSNIITNKEDFGKLLFTQYSYNKGFGG